METTVRASVRICVERRPMCSTVPGMLAGLAVVAQADGFVPDEEEPAEEVLDRLLGGKGHGDAADAEAGHDGREVDARKVVEDDHEPHDDGQGLHERCRKADDRIGGLGPAPLDDLRTGIDQIEEKPRQADDGHRRGQERPEQPGEERGRAEGNNVNRACRKEKHQGLSDPPELAHHRLAEAVAHRLANQGKESPS